MIRKILIIVLFLIFIISACSTSTKETVAPTTATLEAAIEPTLTLSPSPIPSTVTPTMIPAKEYLSCADPELMTSIRNDAVAELGMSLDEYIAKLVQAGKFSRQDPWSPRGSTFPDLVFVGSAEVSIAGLKGVNEGDVVFCSYFVNDEDTTTLIPTIVAFTKNGIYHQVADINDFTGDPHKQLKMPLMQDIRDWFASPQNVKIGDVFTGIFQSFSGVNSIAEAADMDEYKQLFAKEAAELMSMMLNDYLARNTIASSLVETAKNLSFAEGDIGIIGGALQIKERNPLK